MKDIEKSKLLPCPFCASEDLIIHPEWGVVVCLTCSAEGPYGMWNDEINEDNKLVAWNTRI